MKSRRMKKSKRVRKSKRSKRFKGGATQYKFFFYQEDGTLEPGPFNPWDDSVEDNQTLIDLGLDANTHEAYSDNEKLTMINLREKLSLQDERIPNKTVHVFKKGKAVFDLD